MIVEEMNKQINKSSFETVFQEYPLLTLCPFNVVPKYSDLNVGAIWNVIEIIEKGANWVK
jgi:hypothetical protein